MLFINAPRRLPPAPYCRLPTADCRLPSSGCTAATVRRMLVARLRRGFSRRAGPDSLMSNSHFEQVVALLRMEAEAVARAAARVGREEVERAVALLAACRGKVVAVGVGKSGHIAQKVAATRSEEHTSE